MDTRQLPNIVRLGPRIPTAEPEPIEGMDSMMDFALPNLVARSPPSATTTSSSDSTTTASSSDSSSTCAANNNSAACEKPVGSSTFTLPIVLGVAIPVIGAAILFIYLQRRHVRRQRLEDANDRHASLDFGLGDVPQPGRARKPPGYVADKEIGEKGPHLKQRQVSMDIGMESPYLLPPELQGSRESLHSLSRTIHQNEDPYRPVTQYYPGDGSSIRSASKQGREGSSIYTGSSKARSNAPSRMQDLSTLDLLSNASGMSRSSPPTADFVPPPRKNSLAQKSSNPVDSTSETPLPPPPYPIAPEQAHVQDSNVARKGLPSNPRPGPGQSLAPAPIAESRESYASNGDAGLRTSNNYLGAFISSRDPSPPPSPPSKAPERELPGPASEPETSSPARMSPPVLNSLPANPRPVRKESMKAAEAPPPADDASDYGDGFMITPPSPGRENNAELMRGQRYSMDVPPEEFAQAGLGAPGFDPRRLSMGFRPLPPDAVIESDDPEIRANRIRSFYKEYFDDSKPAPQGQYYEDYDENYLGDVAYYDPASNNFVMPYAEPVTRRAMTPPPRGPRFQGPPRAMHGSMGAGSMRGPRGPQMYPPGPYPQGPKAYSSASGRMGPPAKKRQLPPPMALPTIPTPSKLKDDSFAIMNAMDFAPPKTYRDRVAGRSESPLGERRPYSPMVPSFVPTVSAFDELAPMPSPHMLRKSGTFTALDFAPPKKFRDPDSMSDTGSIKSNRSGVSAMQLGAIRNGAYRVSRIQKDMVFTKDDLATTLKPQWGMRAGS